MPDGLNAEFLNSVLREAGVLDKSARVSAVERVQIAEGTGMMAEISRLQLSYEGDAALAPRSFIAKYASQNPTNREIALSYKLYERETRYFAELDSRTDAVSPKPYFSEVEGDNFLILMEDMSDYEVGDQNVGATLGQTELAIDELVKLHASFWNKVSDLDWVPHISDSYHADNMKSLSELGWENMVAAFRDFIPEHIVKMKDDFLGSIVALQKSRDAAPLTLCHGDYRMENLLYGVKSDHHPIAIIDWQGPLIARGIVDVALFLAQSTKAEVRQAHERDLLARYVEGLAAQGISDFSLAETFEDYRHTVLYNWVYVTVVAGTLDVTNERGFAWMSQMVARQVAATDDLGVLKLLPY